MVTPSPALLALNNAHAAELSWLAPERLAWMLRIAYHAASVGDADALLIAFDHTSPYDGGHFRWFGTRYERFAYIDRVVVVPAARGRGLARRLYDALSAQARRDALPMIACEINRHPPNPGSDAFHAALGFEEVGRGDSHGRVVRYLIRRL